MIGRFATLVFEREVAAPVDILWQAWTAPAARAVWAAPTPEVTVEFLEADTRVGGREVGETQPVQQQVGASPGHHRVGADRERGREDLVANRPPHDGAGRPLWHPGHGPREIRRRPPGRLPRRHPVVLTSVERPTSVPIRPG